MYSFRGLKWCSCARLISRLEYAYLGTLLTFLNTINTSHPKHKTPLTHSFAFRPDSTRAQCAARMTRVQTALQRVNDHRRLINALLLRWLLGVDRLSALCRRLAGRPRPSTICDRSVNGRPVGFSSAGVSLCRGRSGDRCAAGGSSVNVKFFCGQSRQPDGGRPVVRVPATVGGSLAGVDRSRVGRARAAWRARAFVYVFEIRPRPPRLLLVGFERC